MQLGYNNNNHLVSISDLTYDENHGISSGIDDVEGLFIHLDDELNNKLKCNECPKSVISRETTLNEIKENYNIADVTVEGNYNATSSVGIEIVDYKSNSNIADAEYNDSASSSISETKPSDRGQQIKFEHCRCSDNYRIQFSETPSARCIRYSSPKAKPEKSIFSTALV